MAKFDKEGAEKKLWCCGLSSGPCAHPGQSAEVSSLVDELARDWVSGQQCWVVCRRLFLRSG